MRRALLFFVLTATTRALAQPVATPQPQPAPPTDPAAMNLDAGRRYYEIGEMAGAKTALDQAIALKPDMPKAYLYRALAVDDMSGLTPEVQADFEKAIALEPSKEHRRFYAEALIGAGKHAEAKAQLEKALADDAAYPDAVWLMGDLYRKQGKLAEAIPWFEKHTQIYPKSDAWHSLGLIYLSLGDEAKARDAFAKDIVGDPTCEVARANLAALTHDAGHTREAIEHYKLALAYHPGDPLMMRGLARAYADVGDLELAVGMYRQVLDLSPGDQEARDGLSDARRRMHFWIALPWAAPPAALLIGLGIYLLIRRARTAKPSEKTA